RLGDTVQAPGNQDKQPNDQPPRPQFRVPRWVWPIIWIALLGWTFLSLQNMMSFASTDQPIPVSYSFFKDELSQGNITQVTIQENQVRGVFKSSETYPPEGSPLLAQG